MNKTFVDMLDKLGYDIQVTYVKKGERDKVPQIKGDREPSPVYYNVFMVEIPIRQMGSFPSCCLSC